MRHTVGLVVSSLFVFLAINSNSYAAIDPATIPIDRFREVTPDIFRGARPSEEALQDLAKEGLKTVIDLEDDNSAISSESTFAQAAGLQFFTKSINPYAVPNDQEVMAILGILEDPANYPVFVHCKLGEDRTGMIIALYRVFDQNWTAADAYNEWVQDGFHTSLTKLKAYFDQKTAGH